MQGRGCFIKSSQNPGSQGWLDPPPSLPIHPNQPWDLFPEAQNRKRTEEWERSTPMKCVNDHFWELWFITCWENFHFFVCIFWGIFWSLFKDKSSLSGVLCALCQSCQQILAGDWHARRLVARSLYNSLAQRASHLWIPPYHWSPSVHVPAHLLS